MDIKTFGEQAVLVNFEQKIDLETHTKVMALKTILEDAAIEGILYYIPAYCSLTISFDRTILDIEFLKLFIQSIEPKLSYLTTSFSRLIKIPVCYDASFALDMDKIRAATKKTTAELIHLHTSINYNVYMLGFLPGFAYMGSLPRELVCPRKETPRRLVPAGSVGLAGQQTGIYPSESPGGWQIIGRSPLIFFDATLNDPFLFHVGDEVQFYAITTKEFNEMNPNY